MAVKIVIDAGHGGYDAGATYNGRREKDDTLALALAVGEILEAQGYDVVYTRTDDVYDSPVQKARIGNESGADFFVSIHRNSSPTPNQYNGVQTLIYNNAGLKATMAENVNKELEQVGYRNINVVERPCGTPADENACNPGRSRIYQQRCGQQSFRYEIL